MLSLEVEDSLCSASDINMLLGGSPLAYLENLRGEV